MFLRLLAMVVLDKKFTAEGLQWSIEKHDEKHVD
jgi:hypothetical protein